MAGTQTLVAFLIAVFIMQVTPGPDMMLIIGRGIGQGRQTALCAVLGMTLVAGLVQLPLLVFGLASLFSSPRVFELLRWTGAIYLLWLGVRVIWVSFDRHGTLAVPPPPSPGRTIREGAINNLTNPKPLLFMFAFLPQFVDPQQGSVGLQLLILGSIQKLLGAIILGCAALVSGALGGMLARRPRLLVWQQRFAGAVMISLGVRLLFTGDARPTRS